MKRYYSFLIYLVAITISLMSFSCSKTETIKIRLINTTDVHGNIFPYDDIKNVEGTGGYSRLATFLKEARMADSSLILVDNGDLLQGEPITYYSNYIDTLGQNAVSKAMNLLGYDVAVMGNHDIEPGRKILDKFKNELNFPLLAGNVFDINTGERAFDAYKIIDRKGVKIAIIGCITPAIPQWVPKDKWEGLRFEDIKTSLEKIIEEVKTKEKAELVVVALHSGWENKNIDYIEDAGKQVAEQVDGIDLLLLGHDHQKRQELVERKDGSTLLVMNSSNHLDFVSDIEIEVEKKGDKIISKKVNGNFVDLNKFAPDEEFISNFLNEREALKSFLDRKVAALRNPIKAEESLFDASSYMTLLHEMQLFTSNAEISFAAPLSINSIVEAGDITMRELFRFTPFRNHLYVMSLTGKQIQGYLEYSYRSWAKTMKDENDNLLIYKDGVKKDDKYKTKTPTFNFSSAYGIDYTVNVSKSPVEVYISQMSNGTPFDMDKTYKVVMTSYRAGGAGGLLTEGAGIPKEELESRVIEILPNDQLYNIMKYLEIKGVIEGNTVNNWKFIPEKWAKMGAEKDKEFMFK